MKTIFEKKILFAVFVVLFLLGLYGCGKAQKWEYAYTDPASNPWCIDINSIKPVKFSSKEVRKVVKYLKDNPGHGLPMAYPGNVWVVQLKSTGTRLREVFVGYSGVKKVLATAWINLETEEWVVLRADFYGNGKHAHEGIEGDCVDWYKTVTQYEKPVIKCGYGRSFIKWCDYDSFFNSVYWKVKNNATRW
jgi:hypothetical protein